MSGFRFAWWDKVSRAMVLAVRSLWLHKLRSSLSVLGIIIGTAAVISLMSFGEGSMQDALEDIARQGATNVIIRSVKPPDDSSSGRRTRIATYGLTKKDYDKFKMIDTVIRSVPMRIFPQEVRRLEKVWNGRVVATTGKYAEVNKFDMATGRFLDDYYDDEKLENHAVLGSTIAEILFPFENPVGQSVVINKHEYLIIGVISERMPTGGVGGSQAAEEFNSDVYIPLRTCQVRFGERIIIRQSGSFSGEQCELHQVTLTVTEMDKVRGVGKAIEEQLKRDHPRKDWAVTVPLDRLEAAERERDRHHEHHGGHRDGTNSRDRHSPRPRRQTPGYHFAVSHRSRRPDRYRRPGRASSGVVHSLRFARPGKSFWRQTTWQASYPFPLLFPARVHCGGRSVRVVSGCPRFPPRSHRSPAARIAKNLPVHYLSCRL